MKCTGSLFKNIMRKLNFLLIMPRLVQNIGDGYVFPLGIAYVSASLKKAGFKVVTLNLNHQAGDDFEIIKKVIQENNIDVVATGGLSPQYHLVKNVIDSAKRAKNSIITIVGGGIISADPATAMAALPIVDYGVIGEGEVTMCELARVLENGGEVSRVDGLIIKETNGYKKTNRREDIANIDLIPWPDYEGFDLEKYLATPSAGFAGLSMKRMIPMLGSRSCPFSCTFCCHTIGKKYRQRSLDDFFAELDYLIAKYDIKYISMADELFAPDVIRAKEFSKRIKKYNIAWYADLRIDLITPELLPILKEGGLNVVFFGLESADNRILKSMRKGITIERTEKVLKLVYESGIAVYGCFIFGDIAETAETAHNTLKWWQEHLEYHIHLTLVKPFPGSYIYDYACQQGIIKDKIQYLKDGCPQVNISKLNEAEFTEIVQQISGASSLFTAIDSLKLLHFDPEMGRETITGVCSKCSHKNTWEDIKLFAIDYIYCSQCGQKYDIPIPESLLENLNKNITALLKKYGKVAVWGMTIAIMDLFRRSVALKDPNVFPIDISESKQQLDLGGKKIQPPAILGEQAIPVVVIAVPSHGGQISCQVKENYNKAIKLIDVCQLVDPGLVIN
jgi:anaerobic magnesium-protoporphyrin IX monomethyl ester cyclase